MIERRTNTSYQEPEESSNEKSRNSLQDANLTSQGAKQLDDDALSSTTLESQSLSTAAALEENRGDSQCTTLIEVVEETKKQRITSIQFPKEEEKKDVSGLKEKFTEIDSECRKLRVELSVLRAFRRTASGQGDPHGNDGDVASELRRLLLENNKLRDEIEKLRSPDKAFFEEEFSSVDGASCPEENIGGMQSLSSTGERRAPFSINSKKKSKIPPKRGIMSCSILSILDKTNPSHR